MQLFVNDLTVMDFSYLCPKRGMVGESWIVDLILHGDLDEQNMVLDFGKVKKQVKRIIDDTVDHKLVIPSEYSNTQVEHVQDTDYIKVSFEQENGDFIHISSPDDAFCFIDAAEVTMEDVIIHLSSVIKPQLPDNVKKVELSLRAENISGFYYHYTHGLKKHDGNCQRIAHGHRSKIQIFENGMKSPRLEKLWSDKWADIYVGTEEDVVDGSAAEFIDADKSQVLFKYESSQGKFELAMESNAVYIMNVDTTVELIAQYIADKLKSENPDNEYKVVAYEGVAKGAIAYA
ncbi:MAG: 6-carboxytetrahydropterin synthase [Gammaproteobacteria bacterium]|nr:6-carboxytetrahydropterin synthase [Gammaproteobacteria bacterium]